MVPASENQEHLKPVFDVLDELAAQNERKIIAIDGRCGSGKSTLARLLAEKYSATVFQMDDFFLPVELRSAERLQTPGGNVHYERFIEEIKEPLLSGRPVRHRAYDCSVGEFSEATNSNLENMIIVEGSYSQHPELADLYDVKIFVTVDPEEQKRRLLEREGEEKLQMFANRWIPMEERYFSSYDIETKSDLIVNTSTN